MAGRVAAVVVAAGRGQRVGGDLPKQYRRIAGEPVIRPALAAFLEHPRIDAVQPVIHAQDAVAFRAATVGLQNLPPVWGGATRQASVHAGLEALRAARPDFVLIHDAARPFLTSALITRAIDAAVEHRAAVPAVPVADTVKKVDERETVTETLDLIRAEALRMAALGDVRTGNGFDVHAFGDGDHVMLGGIRVPHARGLTGHSDADVVLHALVDALLGALADGDIGSHFPPSDPQWRGASSDQFLAFACERVRARSGFIAHLDATVVCEAPRVGPHRDAMRARIAAIAEIPVERVAVKATTSEKLGFTGRGEGIVAMATATVRLPWSAA
jgi:2-C-methyl-D-erythritol 4-phosphate cytidylyltransferase/2-C-methyl-D-erythritol 2,4-cyclodiphosphate synthase